MTVHEAKYKQICHMPYYSLLPRDIVAFGLFLIICKYKSHGFYTFIDITNIDIAASLSINR